MSDTSKPYSTQQLFCWLRIQMIFRVYLMLCQLGVLINEMVVNLDKTNIVHFRPRSIPLVQYPFMYNGQPITVTHKYRYLGLVLDQFLDYSVTAEAVAAARSLGVPTFLHCADT